MTAHDSTAVSQIDSRSAAEALTKPPHKWMTTALLTAAGLTAGYVAAVAIERVHGPDGYFQFPANVSAMFPPMGQPIPAEVLAAKDHANRMLDYKNTMVSLALFGTALTGLFGLAIGIARRRISAAMLGLLSGAALGAMFGLAAGAAEVFAGHQLKTVFEEGDMVGAILKYAAGWIMIAVGTGLTIGIAGGNPRSCGRLIGAAILGGVIAALLYTPAAAILFANEKSDQFVPTETWSRTAWMSSAGILMAVLLAWTLTDKKSTVTTSPAK